MGNASNYHLAQSAKIYCYAFLRSYLKHPFGKQSDHDRNQDIFMRGREWNAGVTYVCCPWRLWEGGWGVVWGSRLLNPWWGNLRTHSTLSFTQEPQRFFRFLSYPGELSLAAAFLQLGLCFPDIWSWASWVKARIEAIARLLFPNVHTHREAHTCTYTRAIPRAVTPPQGSK